MKTSHLYLHYFLLSVFFVCGLTALFFVRYNHALQLSIILVLSLGYVLWGIMHHYHQGDLHPKIVAEYLLFATLAILLVGSVIFRG
jgi:hypothetical protein